MSRLTVTSIRDLQAIQERLARLELLQLARMVSKLAKSEQTLNELEGVEAMASAQLLQQLSQLDQLSTPVQRSELRAEIERASETAKREINAARQRRVSLRLTAQSLLPNASDAHRQSISVAAQRADGAKAAEYRELKKSIESFISQRVLKAEHAPSAAPRSEAAEQLAAAFMTPEQRRSLPVRPIDPRLQKLIATLAELGPQAVDLSERAAALVQHQGGSQYALLLDAVLLDASQRAQLAREEVTRSRLIEDAVDRLAPYDDPDSVEWRAKLSACRTNQVESDQLVRGATQHVIALEKAIDALKARQEIIKGLEAMGYDVAVQGDEWDEGERITASHTRDANYDVQLSAVPGGRVQTKVRAHMHAGRTPDGNLRDFEMEQKWCEDQKSLHDRLSAAQLNVTVEREDPPVEGDVHLVDGERTAPSDVRRSETRRLD